MRFLTLLPLLLFAPSLAAQQASHPCAGVPEPAARLACYDEAFPLPPQVVEAATAKAQADFGLGKASDGLRNPGQTVAQADPDRIEGRVTRVDHGVGQRSFHLEGGQVWTQVDSRTGGSVQAGDTVQVRKAVLGGYSLVTPQGVVLRVRRIR